MWRKNDGQTTEAFETHEIGIAGMTCDNCVKKVEMALRKVEGVADVRVDRQAALARVTFNASKTDIPELHDALLKSGYQPTGSPT